MSKSNLVSCEITTDSMMQKCVDFVTINQLKERSLWAKFTEVFTTREDTEGGRWRGEYFGKQMRSAVLIYNHTKDEELFEILTDTVKMLLPRQDELGRFSTYDVDGEFVWWDVWSRKYVLVGFLYYCDICRDEKLKEQIMTACCKHLDYIVQKIGDKEGQISIVDTSDSWGGVNSASILEPTIEMYKRTGKKDYLDFAKHIISTGGSRLGNLIELAIKNEIAPYQYPVTKAYEMMSFYEGLFAYYEITGEKKYFDAVINFVNAVKETDITIIGCAGCTHELFDNSANFQTEFHEDIMQETCVTVTWMRLLKRIYDYTKDPKYIDWIEVSGYNALYGSLNTENNTQLELWSGVTYPGKAFESYGPLYMNTRGRGIGGFNLFGSGDYYGCCLSIGSAGIAIMPLTAVMQTAEEVYVNQYFNGKSFVKDVDGNAVTLSFDSKYPSDGAVKVTVNCDGNANLKLNLRKPDWCKNMTVDNSIVDGNGYYLVSGEFKDGDVIDIKMEMELKLHKLNGKVAFTYGVLTLATDEWKSTCDIKKAVRVSEPLDYKVMPSQDDELIRISVKTLDGELILADYQACGKKWLSDKPLMTVWFNA